MAVDLRTADELSDQLSEHMNGFLYSAALGVIVRARIADLLVDGPRTPAELGELTGLQSGHLARLLRYLATREVFAEDSDGRFALTQMAQLLREDVPGSLRNSFLMLDQDLYWKPMARLYETVRDGHTAFDDIYGAQFFPYLQSDPERAEIFNNGTAGFSRRWIAGVVQAYDFPPESTVIDVGGGTGSLLRAVLEANPQVTGTLYDQASVLAEHVLDHPEISGRWTAESGDFFAAVPSGYDRYLLKSVLHDWSDEDCLRILDSVRAAMRPGSKLLVIDPVIPPGNEPHPSKTIDAMMMVIHDGKERTRADFEEILTKAGFAVERVIPTRSLLSVIECVVA